MKILFIHGMNQQKYSKDQYKSHLQQLFSAIIDDPDIIKNDSQNQLILPFYGDLLNQYHVKNSIELSRITPSLLNNFHFPIINHFNSNTQLHEHPPSKKTALTSSIQQHSWRSKLKNITTEYSDLFKDYSLKEFSILINHYPNLHESFIHKYLIETYLYLRDPNFTEQVHQRILELIDIKEEYIFIAHSLGTVIAYNILRKYPNILCKSLITLGSPLAFKVIQSRITAPIERPKNISGDWFNIYSTDDFLTTFPLSEAPFNFNPPIFNIPIRTVLATPHNIEGYLNHPVVAHIIDEQISTHP